MTFLSSPTEIEHILANALVEISFTIHHTYMKKNNVSQNSFKAQIEQIMILKKHVSTSLPIQNPHAGPIQTYKALQRSSSSTQTLPFKQTVLDESPSAGPSKISAK
ncbi:hypothetical protein J3R82DRAFT_6699 [Butyriboletus roseoflavus]|nr:hypothetical protein J3R82DRAFT_6699 [Butyriboletus roseoflavus]